MHLRSRHAFVAARALALLPVLPAHASGGMCGPSPEPVLLVLVTSIERVAPVARGLSQAPRLVETVDTVIYADGRAVTSDLAAVSGHLNALGWAEQPIEIAGAGTSSRRPPGSHAPRRRG